MRIGKKAKVSYILFFLVCCIIPFLNLTKCMSADQVTDSSSIKIVQAVLNAEGYDCGAADGIIGRKTRAAIEAYQKDQELTVSGDITDELLEALELTPKILKGVLIDEFVSRYNDAVIKCNAISAETGDPVIEDITKDMVEKGAVTLDGNTAASFLIDDRNVSLRGTVLFRNENKYDIPMVYELIASVYAMDNTFVDLETCIDFVGDFTEGKSASTERMSYSIVDHDGLIYFVILPSD